MRALRFGDLEEDEDLEKEATPEKKEAAAEKQTAKKASTEKTAVQKATPTPTTEIPQEEQIESEGRKEEANVSSEEGAKPGCVTYV